MLLGAMLFNLHSKIIQTLQDINKWEVNNNMEDKIIHHLTQMVKETIVEM